MNFTNLIQKTNRSFGSALLHMAFLAGSVSAGTSASAYYSARRGMYSRKNQSYLGEQSRGGLSKDLSNRKTPVRKDANYEQDIPYHDIFLRQGIATKELIIVDRNVKDYHIFSRMARPGIEVIEIPDEADGLVFLLDTLSGYRGLSAVHLFSHAASGKLFLGNTLVDSRGIQDNTDAFRIMNSAIAPGGDLLLYGCELAKGQAGDEFLEMIKGNTHADVAASNDLSGNANFGGDWELEIQKGDIHATPLQGSPALKDLTGVLQVTFSMDYAQIVEFGAYIGANNNAQVHENGGTAFTLKIDGHIDGTFANTEYVYLGGSGTTNESGVTLSLTGGQAFTPSSLKLFTSIASTFTFTTNLGGTVTRSLGINATATIDLSSLPSGVTSLTFTGSSNFSGYVDDVVFSSVADVIPPTLTNVSSSAANGIYKAGDVIPVTVSFSEIVTVTGTPQITLETGTTDRVINYASGSGTSTLIFNYTIQSGDVSSDLDYTGTGALAFNSGTIKDAAGNNATLTLASPGTSGSLGANKAIVVDAIVPTVSSVSSSTANGTYKTADVIAVTVSFSENVTVTGTPQLTLETGTTDRTVNYSSGSGTSTLTFNYTIQSGDISSDLDYTGTGALALNSGTIKDAAGNNATLTLASPGTSGSLGANKAIVVDAIVPTVSSVSSSTANGTYKTADVIAVTVSFSENVTVTGTPQLTLETGTTDRTVNYSSGSGTSTLTFNYTIQSGDISSDLDYTGTSALALNSGTIKDGAGNNATLTLASPGASGSLGANKALVVDGVAPTVSSVSVPANGTYTSGQNLDFTINATENITVNTGGGTPQLSLTIGSTTRQATYQSGSGSGSLVFRYTVQSVDLDTDGIVTGTLSANGGTLRDAAGNNLNTTLNSVGNTSLVLVSTDVDPPSVSSITVSGSPAANAASVTFVVSFNEMANNISTDDFMVATVSGSADGTVTAVSASSGSSVNITVGALTGTGSLRLLLNSFTDITDNAGNGNGTNGNVPDFTTGSTHSVDRDVPVVSTVNSSTADGTYKPGDVIAVTVNFSEAVTVTGTPQLTLETGTTDRIVNYSSGSGASTLTFNYTIQSGDVSADLNYTSTGALALNGGTIKDGAGNNATLTLASPGASGSLGAFKNIVVDGIVPTVSSVGSTNVDGTYKTGDVIAITVLFSEIVTVTGTPQITLETGTTDRTVNYSSGSGSSTLTFDYTVQSGDVSSDLDYTGTGALALNSGTIKDGAGNNATLTLASPGAAGSISDTRTIGVDGVAPTVSGVSSSTANGTYKTGDVIAVTVSFSENVTVAGPPQLTLETGTTDRTVNYSSGSGTSALTFNYTIQSGDISSDLDYTATNALALNSGTIKDGAGNNATLTLASPGAAGSLGNNKAIVVDGVVPTVSGVSSSTANGTYKTGDVIAVTVSFSENVTITGTPQITLETGTTDRTVDYSSGSGTSTLTFNYTIQSGDLSSDLDYTGTSALALNSGTIKDGAGNNATLTLASPGAAGSLGNNKAIGVDGVVPTVSGVSSSTTNGTYKVGDVIAVTASFSENVTVTGTPQLTLETGATDRTVNYSAGSGTSTLTFNYTIQSGDVSSDLDYTGTSALALNSGTIKDAAGNNAILTLASPGAASSLGNNKAIVVDGVVPTVSGVSSTTANGTYKVGDVIAVTVSFSENVTVTGTPRITLETGATDRAVDYASGSGTATLTFNYTVQSGDQSSDLDYTGTGALALNGGTIKDAAGNNATLTLATPGAVSSLGANSNIVVDGIPPVISSVSVPSNGTYGVTQNLDFTVNSSENVTVNTAGGTPQLSLTIGSTVRQAVYQAGSGTTALAFRYTLQSGELDSDGITVGSLAVNGGTIKDAAGNSIDVSLNGVSPTNGVLVDAVVKEVGVTLSTTVSGLNNTSPVLVTATFEREVTGFTLSDISVTNGTASGLTTSDNKVFQFSVTATSDGPVEVKIPQNKAQDLTGVDNTASNTISYSFDGTAPVATLSKNVANVTNLTSAVVSLQFSEDVTGLTTDDFQVTRGAVTALSGSGQAYTLTCNLTEGTVQVTVKAGAVKDAAGNDNAAASISWEVDLTGVMNFNVQMTDKVINTLNAESASFEITQGEDQATYEYVFSAGGSVQKVTGSGVMAGTSTVVPGIDLSGFPDGTITLSVTMTDRLGNAGQTVQQEVLKKTDVDIPEGLSANGDGANDTWVIPGISNYPNNKVTIFNRWGSVVYEASGYDNRTTVFSGLSNKNFNLGSSLADGTYYYVIQLDHDTIRKGYLVIKK